MKLALVRGNVELGTLAPEPELTQLPWHGATFHSSGAFATFKPLFDEEARWADPFEIDAWATAWRALNAEQLLLVPESGPTIEGFLIRIVGNVARWRVDFDPLPPGLAAALEAATASQCSLPV